MFTTFQSSPDHVTILEGAASYCRDESHQPRRKRHQVARACEWCRTYRIKCDKEVPCRNCRVRDRECGEGNGDEIRTFSKAISEINRLKQQIRQLESHLEQYDNGKMKTHASQSGAPGGLEPSLPKYLDPRKEHGGNKRHWECVNMITAHSHETQCYGPASAFYFLGRLGGHLGSMLRHPHLDHFLPHIPTERWLEDTPGSFRPSEDPFNFLSLPKSEEEVYLSYFWQSYLPIYPILDEFEFTEHYSFLWNSSDTHRRPSALVDIMLALCIQHNNALITSSAPSKADINERDVVTDRSFYRKCQAQLAGELEGPSVRTLQCHIFSVIYLCNASFQNTAHSILAQAIRVGIILGFHLEPPESLPEAQREFRKRLWWTLYALEMKMAMNLGRPLAVNISQVTCCLPNDDPGKRILPHSLLSTYEEADLLTYNVQYIRLILATRSVYITFYNKCAEILGQYRGRNIYDDPEALETCADYLFLKMKYLDSWLIDVPVTLMTRRIMSGKAFSTDGSLLDLTPHTAIWHQRQAAFLELSYHNYAVNLYRPFVCFSRVNRSTTPLVELNASSCAQHAMTIINIVHQFLTETELLHGWHESFHWQWNATISLIGYILAYPDNTISPRVRTAISTAIKSFEIMSASLAIASSAASIARDLSANVNALDQVQRCDSEVSNPFVPRTEIFEEFSAALEMGSEELDFWDLEQNQMDILLQWPTDN